MCWPQPSPAIGRRLATNGSSAPASASGRSSPRQTTLPSLALSLFLLISVKYRHLQAQGQAGVALKYARAERRWRGERRDEASAASGGTLSFKKRDGEVVRVAGVWPGGGVCCVRP